MPNNSDTKVLEVVRRQARQHGVVDLVLMEGRLVLFEAKSPQPTSEIVHNGAPCFAYRCMIPQPKQPV